MFDIQVFVHLLFKFWIETFIVFIACCLLSFMKKCCFLKNKSHNSDTARLKIGYKSRHIKNILYRPNTEHFEPSNS